MPVTESDSAAADRKNRLRAQVRATRSARPESSRSAAKQAVATAVIRWCRDTLSPGDLVAAYVPLASEPLATELPSRLAAAGHDVIVPVTLADNDLDWRRWDTEQRLGLDAIGSAALVLVPAFAVDPLGRRLGRGAGCYDRALGRTSRAAVVAAVLYDDELLTDVPAASWDIAVTGVFSPAGFGVRPLPS